MGCLFDHLTLWASFFLGFVVSVLLGAAILYIWASQQPFDTRQNDPGA